MEGLTGILHLPDEIGKMIDSEVALGRALTASDFVEEAVRRFIDDAHAEEDEIAAVMASGIADIEAGRFVLIDDPEESSRVFEGIVARARAASGHEN